MSKEKEKTSIISINTDDLFNIEHIAEELLESKTTQFQIGNKDKYFCEGLIVLEKWFDEDYHLIYKINFYLQEPNDRLLTITNFSDESAIMAAKKFTAFLEGYFTKRGKE